MHRDEMMFNLRLIKHWHVLTPIYFFLTQGMIEAIYLDEGELISAGVDGYIRVSMQ